MFPVREALEVLPGNKRVKSKLKIRANYRSTSGKQQGEGFLPTEILKALRVKQLVRVSAGPCIMKIERCRQ